MKKAGQTSSRDSHKPKEPSWYKHKRGDEEATINSPSSRNQKPNAVKLKHANSTAKTTSKADGGAAPNPSERHTPQQQAGQLAQEIEGCRRRGRRGLKWHARNRVS